MNNVIEMIIKEDEEKKAATESIRKMRIEKVPFKEQFKQNLVPLGIGLLGALTLSVSSCIVVKKLSK